MLETFQFTNHFSCPPPCFTAFYIDILHVTWMRPYLGVLSRVTGSTMSTSSITNPDLSRPRTNEIVWVSCEALLPSKTKLGYKSVACLMRVRIVLIQFDFQFSVVDNTVKQKVPSIEDMCGFPRKTTAPPCQNGGNVTTFMDPPSRD